MTTTTFFVSHVLGSILGSVLGVLGVAAWGLFLSSSRRPRLALSGVTATVIGTVFITAIFGLAPFAQPALGDSSFKGSGQAQALYDAMYDAPSLLLGIAGALLISLGTILLGLAARTSEQIPRWAATTFGVSGPFIGILGIPSAFSGQLDRFC